MSAQTCFYSYIWFKIYKNYSYSKFSCSQKYIKIIIFLFFISSKFQGVTILPPLRWISSRDSEDDDKRDRDSSSLDCSLLHRVVPSSW
jgi:hypothetical protein